MVSLQIPAVMHVTLPATSVGEAVALLRLLMRKAPNNRLRAVALDSPNGGPLEHVGCLVAPVLDEHGLPIADATIGETLDGRYVVRPLAVTREMEVRQVPGRGPSPLEQLKVALDHYSRMRDHESRNVALLVGHLRQAMDLANQIGGPS